VRDLVDRRRLQCGADARDGASLVKSFTDMKAWLMDRECAPTDRTAGVLKARCPVHDDGSPSLDLRLVDDKWLIHCHAGCAFKDVVDGLGLDNADLFAAPNQNGQPGERLVTKPVVGASPGRRKIAEYRYVDVSGNTVLTKLRFEPKDFVILPPKRMAGMEEIPLYNLPAIRRAVADGMPVLLVEGEKDADAAVDRGFAATCNIEGASGPGTRSKWRPEYVEQLQGANVTIVQDKDVAGRHHARDVLDRLRIAGISATIVEAKDGKDLFDHFAAGFDVAELVDVEAVEDRNTTISVGPRLRTIPFSEIKLEELTWLWPGYLPLGKVGILEGDPGTGKSTCSLDFAARVTTGSPWPCGAPGSAPADVLVLSAEDGAGDTIKPRLIAAGADESRVHFVDVVVDEDSAAAPRSVSLPRDVALLEEEILRHNARFAIVDVFTSYLDPKLSANSDQDVRRVLTPLAKVAAETSCFILILRHLNKKAGDNPLYRGGGSIGISGAARAAYLIGRDPEDHDRMIMVSQKNNLGPDALARAYRLVGDESTRVARLEWEPDPVEFSAGELLTPSDGSGSRRRQKPIVVGAIQEIVSNAGGRVASKALFEQLAALGISEGTAKRCKVAAGVRAEKDGSGGWSWVSDDQGID